MYLEYKGLFNRARQIYFIRVLKRFALGREDCELLDYGCGPGDMLALAKSFGINARGLDVSERSVELAQEKGLSAEVGDYRRLQAEQVNFDVIFVQSVIEHVQDPVHMVKSLATCLKPNGVLIVSAPTPSSDFWDDPTHVRPHTPRSLAVIGELAGLRVLEINYIISFLVGIKVKTKFLYKLLNMLPIPLGSNLIAIYSRKLDREAGTGVG